MFSIFNFLIAPLVPALWFYTLHRRFVRGKSAASYAGQWGRVSPAMRKFGRQRGPKIWLHAVSVGETMAARPLARAMRAQMPDAHLVLSSTTDAGHAVALAAVQAGEAELAIYFPLDLPWVLTRVLNALRPDAIGFVETELWPNLLELAKRRGIKTFQLNGRVSDNLLQNAPRLGPLWWWMKGNVTRFAMRGAGDAARLRSLGVDADKISVVGDVKLEAPAQQSDELRRHWRAELGLRDGEKLLICGSTHAGEEAMVLDVTGDWRLAIAPRHLERADDVAALVTARGMRLARRSRNEKLLDENAVYLLDSVGELADFYAAGDVAMVGGSLIERGGHNVLEPVLRGVPVVFGPHMMNFRAAAGLVCENQLGEQIDNAREIRPTVARWLDAATSRAEFATRVEAALTPHRGAATRAAQLMARELGIETPSKEKSLVTAPRP